MARPELLDDNKSTSVLYYKGAYLFPRLWRGNVTMLLMPVALFRMKNNIIYVFITPL